jgi:toxin-antitoxin system PIN domain toxin
VQWFLAAPTNSCCFCRLTQQGFLRLLTTPQVMDKRAQTLPGAWQAYDDLYNDPRVVYADEPENVEIIWRSNTQKLAFSPKVWNDAYLAAFAQAAGFEIVTFDRGFEQYKDVVRTILS